MRVQAETSMAGLRCRTRSNSRDDPCVQGVSGIGMSFAKLQALRVDSL